MARPRPHKRLPPRPHYLRHRSLSASRQLTIRGWLEHITRNYRGGQVGTVRRYKKDKLHPWRVNRAHRTLRINLRSDKYPQQLAPYQSREGTKHPNTVHLFLRFKAHGKALVTGTRKTFVGESLEPLIQDLIQGVERYRVRVEDVVGVFAGVSTSLRFNPTRKTKKRKTKKRKGKR